jgi:ATP-dependent helicase HrpA
VERRGSFAAAVADVLTSFGGPVVRASDIDTAAVPDHLRVRVRVVGDDGEAVAAGRDLAGLQQRLAERTRSALARVAPLEEQSDLRTWTVGTLPRTVEVAHGAGTVAGYPALVLSGGRVALRVLTSPQEQHRAMPTGVRGLLLRDIPSPVRAVVRRLDGATKLALSHQPYPTVAALLDDTVAATVDRLVAEAGLPWDEAAYTRLRSVVTTSIVDSTEASVRAVADVLATAHEVSLRTAALDADSLLREDLEVQMQGLVFDGFVTHVGVDRLPDLARYLAAMRRRLDVAVADPARDRHRMAEVHEVEDAYLDRLDRLPAARRHDEDVTRVRWMLEELRVSLFAQHLGTPSPVSAPRIRKALAALD